MPAAENTENPQTPDPVVPGPAPEPTVGPGRASGRETLERQKAWQRGEARAASRASARAAAGPEDVPPAPDVPTAAQEAAFIALAENVRDYAIFLMDPEGIIRYWGEGARLIKWWTRDQAVGAHFRIMYMDGGSEDGTAEGHLAEAVRRGEMVSEGQRVRSDGSTFWAGATLTPLRDAEGRLLGFAKLTRDLTAAHAAEEALRAAKEATEAGRKLEAANRLKGEFLSVMSHELRTPLQAIIAYSELLELEIAGPLNDVQRQQLGRIRVSSKHLLGLTQEVLDLTRLEQGRVTMRPATHKLGEVAAAALTMTEPQAVSRGIALTSAVSGSAGELCYWGDVDRVRQILVNILANAVKFTSQGGRITVSAGSTKQAPPDAQLGGGGPWVYVRVEDTGEGIPPDKLATIFEPYEQVGSPTEGAGLGLAISRRLAHLMSGDLTATSEVGVGSSFFLWLESSATPPPAAAG